jgi:hypothetical protein
MNPYLEIVFIGIVSAALFIVVSALLMPRPKWSSNTRKAGKRCCSCPWCWRRRRILRSQTMPDGRLLATLDCGHQVAVIVVSRKASE